MEPIIKKAEIADDQLLAHYRYSSFGLEGDNHFIHFLGESSHNKKIYYIN